DALGSVRVVTDQQKNEIERHDYLPFGEEWCGTDPCAAVKTGQPLRFAGKARDVETALDYLGARYLDTSLARFTTVDTALDPEAALANPQKWNRYAYVLNN